MRRFVVFLCYWAVSSAYILRQEKDEERKTRKTLQNKAYTTERREQTARKTIWTQNLKVRHETVILVTHFYFLLFQWRCTFNLAHIYEKRREDYVAKVRITFQTISDERQIMKQQPQARQAGPLFTWALFSYRLRSEQCCIERYRWMLRLSILFQNTVLSGKVSIKASTMLPKSCVCLSPFRAVWSVEFIYRDEWMTVKDDNLFLELQIFSLVCYFFYFTV